jgi:pyruvate formate lyase activating enzyme
VPALRDILDARVREADPSLYEKLDNHRVRCFSCGHCCPIPEGQPGVCKVRYNRGGTLYAPWGYTAGMQCDPIEKKPFFHAHPGALAYSFGMLGCDLHCGYCQNWVTSQALRDPNAVSPPLEASPEMLVRDALDQGAKVLVSTYNEPLITSEWAVAVFKEARAAGLLTGFVSNGNATPQVLEYLRPHLDLYKVDLKSFDDRHYHELGGRIAPILDSIRRIHAMGLWLEIVTLLIPGFNDSPDELRRLTEFLAAISPDIPWHVTAFHGDYKMQSDGQRDTNVEDLLRAAEIGQAAGLRYIYAGNLPGRVGPWEDTRCPQLPRNSNPPLRIPHRRLPPHSRRPVPEMLDRNPRPLAPKFAGQITSRPFLPQNRPRLFTITSR